MTGQELGRKQNSLQMVQINRPEWREDFRVGAWGGRQGFGNKWRRARNPEAGQQCAATRLPWKEETKEGNGVTGEEVHPVGSICTEGPTCCPRCGSRAKKEGRRNIWTKPLPPSNLLPPICQIQANARELNDSITGSNSQIVVQSWEGGE